MQNGHALIVKCHAHHVVVGSMSLSARNVDNL